MTTTIGDRKRGIWRFEEKTETVVEVVRLEAPREVRPEETGDPVREPKLYTGLYL